MVMSNERNKNDYVYDKNNDKLMSMHGIIYDKTIFVFHRRLDKYTEFLNYFTDTRYYYDHKKCSLKIDYTMQ